MRIDLGKYNLLVNNYGISHDGSLTEDRHSILWAASVGIAFWDSYQDPIADIISFQTFGEF